MKREAPRNPAPQRARPSRRGSFLRAAFGVWCLLPFLVTSPRAFSRLNAC